jgi:NhaA family Na+:H+ antiporter
MIKKRLFTPPEGEENLHKYHTEVEKKVTSVLSPFQEYIKGQSTAGLLLLTCTIVALVWASVPSISSWYYSFTNISLGINIGNFHFQQPLKLWVNDFLLALFFFYVGLEIKREFLVGELNNRKSAMFVIVAATGGMVIPAAFYILANLGTDTYNGWGIPMATDTAFALGILSLFKRKIPSGIFTFIAALAIIDDIGVVLIIAFFYTGTIDYNSIFMAIGLCMVLLLVNISGFRKPYFYFIIGILIWITLESAGIHGTVAGIIVAFLVPARPRKGPILLTEKTRNLIDNFEQRKDQKSRVIEDPKQHDILEELQQVAHEATTPLQRWESKLELPITLFILPLFALVNAGVTVNLTLFHELFFSPVAIGIILGLVIGKPLGVIVFSKVATLIKLGELPKHTSFRHLISVSFLTGIGFTMSLFINNLSFSDEHTLLLAKAAILLSSFTAGIIGIICIIRIKPKNY